MNTEEAWSSLDGRSTPLVLVRGFSEGNFSSQIAVNNGHHVPTPLYESDDPRGDGCKLPRLGRDETVPALTAMGLSEEKARSLIRKTARRLPVIRRFLIDEAERQSPAWVSTAPRPLIPLVLLGQWEENHQGDKKLIEALVGKPYEEVEWELVNLTVAPDPPVVKVGKRWRFLSHEEAWHLLAPGLTSSDVNRLERIAAEVLGAISPEFELPVGERYMAVMVSKVIHHSDTLRQGIARSLVLMGTQPERAKNADGVSHLPSGVVSSALSRSKDWRIWATLNDELSTLAEAAPEALLGAA